MSDYTSLKRLAESCGNLNWRFQQENWTEYTIRDDHGYIAVMRVKSAKHPGPDPDREAKATFLGAATPATVLALIAENESLALKHAEAGRLYLELAAERDQLKAEVDSLTREADRQYTTIEAYRKDAERFQWLLKNASVILDKKTAYQAETGFIKFDTMPGRTETVLAIDAAMGSGEQP